MKTIIAGGRDYQFTKLDEQVLDGMRHEFSLVVSGGAKGADACGEAWARSRGIPVRQFPADWSNLSHPDALIRTRRNGQKYDARAGFRRNQQMAQFATGGICILFPGGNGTADMKRRAMEYGMRIVELGK